jgi:nitric oxide reductase NorQ protein
VHAGLPLRSSAVSAIASPLTDDAEIRERLTVLIDSYL